MQENVIKKRSGWISRKPDRLCYFKDTVINHIEIFTSSVTKSVLLTRYNHINQADIFASAHH